MTQIFPGAGEFCSALDQSHSIDEDRAAPRKRTSCLRRYFPQNSARSYRERKTRSQLAKEAGVFHNTLSWAKHLTEHADAEP